MTNIAVVALLCINNTLLLLRRAHTISFGAGQYSMPGGKVEYNETALQAIHREILEETGLDIAQEKFELVHTFHRKGTDSAFIALCFKVDISSMQTPRNMEPTKCDDMGFFAFDQLPQNILSAHKQAIESIERGISYSQHGW